MRLVLCLAFAVSACAQPTGSSVGETEPSLRRADSAITRAAPLSADTVAVVDHVIPLGEGTVTVRVRLDGQQPGLLHALNLHDDESTSVEAAAEVIARRGGRVVEVVHSGDRNVTFRVGGRSYEADPNRMFTEAGRARTLGALSSNDPAAEAALEAFADSVLALYTAVRPDVVVTLHNNTPDNYSARSYEPGAQYASDAAAVTVHPGSDPDDFFFVTDRALYDALVGEGFNAVLQDNDAATDDGSLSVWAAREGVPYVNVEAQHGHRAEQAAMIDALVDVLENRR
ncbi:MAG: hypothetical protein CMM85_10710 [Rhodothermaceae bacterium]|nr:hypothetical protein [Rhodothermaceae bacterium]